MSNDMLADITLTIAIYGRISRVIGVRHKLLTHYIGQIKHRGDTVVFEFYRQGSLRSRRTLCCDTELALPKQRPQTTILNYDAFTRRNRRVAIDVVKRLGITKRTRLFAGQVVGKTFIYGIA